MNKTETLTRRELFDLVWTTPLTTLSRKYHLSDNGLRKICIRMRIPLPTAGHWMRMQYNKNVNTASLPANYKGEETVTIPFRTTDHPVTPPDAGKRLAGSMRQDTSIPFEVPERLHTKNPFVLAAKDRLTQKNRHEKTGVVSCHLGELDIKVGINNIGRMLRFADTLLKVLEKRGHKVEISASDTYAVINGQRLKILFRERLKKHIVKGKYFDSTELHPTGILLFRLDEFYGKEWKDSKEKLEYYLPDIVAFLEMESIRCNERDEKRKKEHLAWEQKEQLKKEIQASKDKNLSEFISLLQKSERWHKAINLRNYISEVELKGIADAEWLTWARQKADWFDPFQESPDEMLDSIDRNTLAPMKT